jgi:polar amino acid transport system substrate-binding protein
MMMNRSVVSILRGLKDVMACFKKLSPNFTYLAFLFFVMLLFSYSPGSLSQEKEILQVRTISIAPYGIESIKEASGIYYDLANILAHETGYQVENYIYPYARIIHELKSGKTDLTIMFKYKELEDFVTYIAPLPTLRNVVIGKKNVEFSSIFELRGKRIAYLRGAKFSSVIDDDSTIFKYETIDFQQGLMMLKNDRVDAVIGPMDAIVSAGFDLGLGSDFYGKPLFVSERTPWLQVSKKREYLISVDKLASHFQVLLKRGELTRLRDIYVRQ